MEKKSYPFHIYFSAKIMSPLLKIFDGFKDLADLIVRLWVANIFFTSGLSKLTDWGATLVLFKYDYHVPIISAKFAAYLGTGAEFLLPILFVLGLGGRFSIFCFFIYNLICMVSFHFLWTPVGRSGLYDHINWGMLLLLIMFHGPGRISVDHLLRKNFGHLLKLGLDKKPFWVD